MTLFKTLLARLANILKRIPDKVWNIALGLLISFALVISLMPIIAWYAGLFGIAYLAYEWFKKRNAMKTEKTKMLISELLNFKHSRKALYIILFGVIIHGSCRIHSQLLINGLYREAIHEKNIIITNVENVEKNEN